MHRITPFSNQSALLACLILSAIASWWLGSLSTQASHEFAGLPTISRQAASVLLILQWLAVAFLARPLPQGTQGRTERLSQTVSSILVLLLPFWPLLALCWMSSDLAAGPLLLSQLAVFTFATVLSIAWRGLPDRASQAARQLIGTAFCVLAVTISWANRELVVTWFIV